VRQKVIEKVQYIINEVNRDGLRWKKGKDIKHLRVRKEYGHIPNDFTLKDYEAIILNIMNGRGNDIYLYFVQGFKKHYFVFGDGLWIVIIGEDCVMETSFPIDGDYFDYLSKKNGYEYFGKAEEVFNDV
jgi:hypothetical protein